MPPAAQRPELGGLRHSRPFDTEQEFHETVTRNGELFYYECFPAIKSVTELFADLHGDLHRFFGVLFFLFFADEIMSIVSKLRRCIPEGIPLARTMDQFLARDKLFSWPEEDGQGNPGLIKLECSLLEMGANKYICQGVFYMIPIQVDDVVILR